MNRPLILGPLAFWIHPERTFWAEYVDGKYGLAITYWQRNPRSRWQWGVRFSLLWGHNRPFVRVTSYSCPSVGSAGVVKPLDCVLPPPKYTKPQ